MAPGRSRLPWVALALVLAGGGIARGDDAAQIDQLFAEGRSLLDQNDPAGACHKFQAAIALDPTAPGVMLNLGLCNERISKFATSLYWFRKAQAAAAEAQLPEYEKAATDHTVTLATQVATARIDVSHAPAAVEVRVDGRLIQPIDYAHVEVDATSQIDAVAPNHAAWHRQLALTSRDAGTITIQLAPLELGKGQRRVAYILGATGVAAVVASAIYANHVQNAYDRGTMPDRDATTTTLRYKAGGIFVGGAALIAAGVIVYLTAPSVTTERSPRAALAPVVTGDQLGLAVLGAF